jgi:nucleotide-binding universal stress UspA family protein
MTVLEVDDGVMPAPILVGFDPDGADRAPVHFATAAARFTGAPLVVGSVHADEAVIAELVLGHGDGDLLLDPAESLDHIRRELAGEGLQVEVRAFAGSSTARALHEAADQLGAGLIVVGSARGGQQGRLRPGSTASRLLHGAPCPVAVVPHGWQAGPGLRTIGVAFVDTPEAHEALSAGVALARRAGAKLCVLSAAKPHGYQPAAHAERLRQSTTYETVGSDLEARIEQAITTVTGGKPDIEIEPDVSIQDPADFLIAASQNLDPLVCGSRGYGPQRAVLMGGVTRRVTAEAHCPVIVLVRGAETGLETLIGARAGATA